MTTWSTLLKTAATALAIGLAVMSLPGGKVLAGEQPNLLVVGEDADEDTVPRNSRVFNRVLQAIQSEMGQLGFRVYDETAVSMGITNPGRIRRVDAEVISVAQRVQTPPIDAIVIFQIYASVQRNNYADIMDLNIRIPGRMLQVQTGLGLGNFEVAYGPRDLPPLPPNCNRECALEHIGGQAKQIAHDVGAVLAQKLAALSPARPGPITNPAVEPAPVVVPTAPAPIATPAGPPSDCTGMTTAYTIVLRGFESQEVMRIQEYLTAFKGYDHYRPIRSQMRYAEYWYESCIDSARLERNLHMTMEQMGLQARISMRANRFELDKIAAPQTR
ncbi:hypothetical protein [Pinisolibacter aquiterrae]|uniref:hypothetical protein n=1 Tax=Pinisolibacter aquiterrae TaxID=2815579 RepID=UPI001C3D1DD7|nr:hypothetical protein [Pinisolibacter aquiterrae]MBV5265200.1 hypothetical protein [Pinisolibacter aquiterrae]MCC8235470.1 hypothetical protein [Pinisolibacter aquiterrae]